MSGRKILGWIMLAMATGAIVAPMAIALGIIPAALVVFGSIAFTAFLIRAVDLVIE